METCWKHTVYFLLMCASAAPPRLDTAYNFSATLVPASAAARLQAVLDSAMPCELRLEAHTDYGTDPANRSQRLPPLRLRSGCQIYGLPNATLPPLIVPAGTTTIEFGFTLHFADMAPRQCRSVVEQARTESCTSFTFKTF